MFRTFKIIFVFFLLVLYQDTFAQVAINEDGTSADSTAMLDISSTDKGMLVPRMTTIQRDSIQNPAIGLLVYDTDEDSFWYYEDNRWYEIATQPDRNGLPDFVAPDSLSSLAGGERYGHMVKEGDHLFLFDDDNRNWMISVDVSNPTEPLPLDTFNFSNSFSFGFNDVAVRGNYAYVLDAIGSNRFGKISIVDISNPSELDIIANYSQDSVTYASISIKDNYAYVMDSYNHELLVFDISNPQVITEVASLDSLTTYIFNPGNCVITTLDNYAYVLHADTSGYTAVGQVSVLDISDPVNPVVVGSLIDDHIKVDLNDGPHKISLYDDHLYLANIGNYFGGHIIDVRDKNNPIMVVPEWWQETAFVSAFSISGNYVYSIFETYYGEHYFGVQDLTDINNPQIIFQESIIDPYTWAVDVIIEDNIAYVLSLKELYIYEVNSFYTEVTNPNGPNFYEPIPNSWEAGSTLPEVDGSNGQVLSTDGNGNTNWVNDQDQQKIDVFSLNGNNLILSLENDGENDKIIDLSSIGDDLGSHTATQTLDLAYNNITNVGDVTANSYTGDGAGLTNVPGDNMGNHTATQTLNLSSNDIINAGTVTASSFQGDGSSLINLPGDDLGSHTATQNIQLSDNWLSNDGGNEGISVDDSGNVGIGIDQPNAVLDVNGEILLSHAVTDMGFVSELENTTPILNLALNVYTPSVDANRLGGMFRIDSRNQSNDPLFQWIQKPVGATGVVQADLLMALDNSALKVNRQLEVGSNGDGTVGIANDWDTWSDRRLKRDFREIADPIQKLRAINGYYYYWTEDKIDQTRQVGVIAQEIETVLPELVNQSPDGYKSVNYAKLAALLIEVNQAQQKEIEQLKSQVAKIEHLEAIVHQLQAQNQGTGSISSTHLSTKK